MRASPTLLLALAAACLQPSVRAEDAAAINPAQQVNQLAPASTTVTEKQVDPKRADSLQNSRATLPAGVITEPLSPLNGQTSSIDVSETKPKTIVPRKEAAISMTPLPQQNSNLNGQTAGRELQQTHVFPGSGTIVDKYQQRMSDANVANSKIQPKFQQSSSFAPLNRFVYQHNGPGSAGGAPLVTAAGGGPASSPQVQTSTPAAEAPPSSEAPGGGFQVLGVFSPHNAPLPGH